MGLERSQHVPRILIHPTNPDPVYVAAMGPLWTSGGERGVYRSRDGGRHEGTRHRDRLDDGSDHGPVVRANVCRYDGVL